MSDHERESAAAASQPRDQVDDLNLLLAVLPPAVGEAVAESGDQQDLVEIVLDLGRAAEVRFFDRAIYLESLEVSRRDLEAVVEQLGEFTGDNRAGIERTLHRISAIRNRRGHIVGLTCRVGRAVTGTVEIIRDVVESGQSILLLGPPGVGKTTLLREAARVLAGDLQKRVVIVDTSNEIAGDGDVPHPGIGRARRMQVPSPELQHKIMIEAVENHMPEVIVIDEIGTMAEAMAARTIAERGVQLVGTAHGITLENLIVNPTLADLIGGVQAVTLSDEEARRRGTQKTVLERKAPPTFDVLVEIQERHRLAVYSDLARVVDRLLTGMPIPPEIRLRRPDGGFDVLSGSPQQQTFDEAAFPTGGRGDGAALAAGEQWRRRRIFPVGVNRSRLQRAIEDLGVHAGIALEPAHADVIVSLKAQRKRLPKKIQQAVDRGIRFHTIKSNTYTQVRNFLSQYFGLKPSSRDRERIPRDAMEETEDAVVQVQRSPHPVELSPQNARVRRRQHEFVQQHGLYSESRGKAPLRRVVVFPTAEESFMPRVDGPQLR